MILGEIGIVNSAVSKKIDKKANIVYAEIDTDAFAAVTDLGISYVEPTKFPEIEIDLSFVSDKFAPIAEKISEQNCSLIRDVSVADVYNDENGKSITVKIIFSHSERTLTKDEVAEVTDKLIKDLANVGITLKNM